MSKLIRGVFLALALCVGLSAAALAQRTAPQLRGFPTPEAAADALDRSDPQQRRQGDDRPSGLDLARVRARRRPG